MTNVKILKDYQIPNAEVCGVGPFVDGPLYSLTQTNSLLQTMNESMRLAFIVVLGLMLSNASITANDKIDVKTVKKTAKVNWHDSEKRMRTIHVITLLPGHLAEQAEDVLNLQKEVGISDVCIFVNLYPEKPPFDDKIDRFCELFLDMKKRLSGSGLRMGALIQPVFGTGDHGQLANCPGFRHMVSMDGHETMRICPMDSKFQDYVYSNMSKMTKAGPDFFVIEDSFRFWTGGRNQIGCFCKEHMKLFNETTGYHLTREDLARSLELQDPDNRKIGALWEKTLSNSLVELSKIVRQGIDAVNANVPCGLNLSLSEIAYAKPIALALAGNTQPFVRTQSSYYLENGFKFFPRVMYQNALQAGYLKNDVSDILAEADTFPQHRYSESALTLKAQITASLLNGCNGLFLWISRRTTFEPECGLAYREMLEKNRGFFQKLNNLTPHVTWIGPSSPFPSAPVSSYNPITTNKSIISQTWAGDYLGRLGIPCCFGGFSNIAMLAGDEVDFFSDNELKDFLKRGLLLDGSAAEKFCQRGLSEYLGVTANSETIRASYEQFVDNPALSGESAGRKICFWNGSFHTRKITIHDDQVQVLSLLMAEPLYTRQDAEKVALGSTFFKNSLGGRVIIFASSLVGDIPFGDGSFNFIDGARKKQLVNILKLLDASTVPIVINSDLDIYAKCGSIAPECGGGMLLCVFNLNPDASPELRLQVAKDNISEINSLSESGEWKKTAWKRNANSELIVKLPVEMMKPLILRIR